MRIAVTGSTGFIGGHLVRRLAADGHRVLALGRRPSSPASLAGIDYAAWDLGHPDRRRPRSPTATRSSMSRRTWPTGDRGRRSGP